MKNIVCTMFTFILFSCSNNSELENEIIQLRAENKKLTDSINFYQVQELVSLKIMLKNKSLKMNQNNKVEGYFVRFDDLPIYNLYKIDSSTNKRIKILENQQKPHFEFNYQPVSKNDTLLNVILEMESGGKRISLPGRLDLKMSKK